MTPAFKALVEAFQVLPGVGPKSAQRMALHLLQRDREAAGVLARSLDTAIERIRNCERCRNLSETALCTLCADERRDGSLLCVVESPADVLVLEQTGRYRGRYFVLHGRLSPIDGIGPEALAMDRLESWVAEGEIREVIVATNATVEGEATGHYLADRLSRHGVTVSRLAQGVPLGGELEYLDGNTLSEALSSRRTLL